MSGAANEVQKMRECRKFDLLSKIEIDAQGLRAQSKREKR
jgi:hypothetical protein